MELLTPLAGMASAVLLGGMLFFAFAFAPLVFVKLPAETAGPFIRQVFPVYYAVGAGCAGLAGLLAALPAWPDAAVLAVVSAGFVLARQGLMPRINRLRDAALAGDESAKRPFARLHRVSMILNLVQMIAVAWVAWRLVS